MLEKRKVSFENSRRAIPCSLAEGFWTMAMQSMYEKGESPDRTILRHLRMENVPSCLPPTDFASMGEILSQDYSLSFIAGPRTYDVGIYGPFWVEGGGVTMVLFGFPSFSALPSPSIIELIRFMASPNNGSNLSPAIEILHTVENARQEATRRVCDVLQVAGRSTIADILIENANPLRSRCIYFLLETVIKIFETYTVQQDIADWPFVNFWANPNEPYHSKLIAYFIDPKREHLCGQFLLGKLLLVLRNAVAEIMLQPAFPEFSADRCSVVAEKRDYQPGEEGTGQIDLFITRNCEDGKYAIILENKVNCARNRPRQLQMYMKRALRKFAPHQVFIFFLPLTDDLEPDPEDKKAVEKQKEVTYAKITFEKHIRAWLDSVISDWPSHLDKRIQGHLSYYKALIEYLINDRKLNIMDEIILKQLELAEKTSKLPSLAETEEVRASLDALERCLRNRIQAGLLMEIRAILMKRGERPWFSVDSNPKNHIDIENAYHPAFGDDLNLCIRADDDVSVCVGGNRHGRIWRGYMKSGTPVLRKEDAVLVEARIHLRNISFEEDPWYAFEGESITYDDKCIENYASKLADTVLDMRNSLVVRLKGVNPSVSI